MIDEANRMDGRKFDLKTTSTSRVEPLEKGLGEAGQVKHEVFFLSPVHLVACDTAHLGQQQNSLEMDSPKMEVELFQNSNEMTSKN